MHVLATVVGFCLLGLAYGASQSARRHHVRGWLDRVHLEQEARDLASSALEEAALELMEEVNRPGGTAFAQLRGPLSEEVRLDPLLARTKQLAAQHPELELVRAKVSIGPRRALAAELPLEWVGRVRCEVEVAARVGGRIVMEGVAERDVRASVIAPVPFDRVTYLDAARITALDPTRLKRALTLDPWRARATLRVMPDADGEVQPAFEALLRRLGRLDGIVMIENAGKRPLRLTDRAFAGRAVLVVAGPLVASEVRLADRHTDLLTVIAFGDTSMDGALEGAWVLAASPETGAAAHRGGADLAIRGALVVAAGDTPLPSGVVEPLDTLVATDAAGRIAPDRVLVSVSPQLVRHSITSRSSIQGGSK